MKTVATIALAALLAGCAGTNGTMGSTAAGPTLPYTGDERGGKIPNGFNDVPGAMNTARAHCAKYNKKAAVTQMDAATSGGTVAFQCL